MRIMAQTHKCKNVATTTNALLACHLIDTNLKSVPARKAKKPDRSTGFGTSQVIISPTNKISHSHGSPYLYSNALSLPLSKTCLYVVLLPLHGNFDVKTHALFDLHCLYNIQLLRIVTFIVNVKSELYFIVHFNYVNCQYPILHAQKEIMQRKKHKQ